MRIKASLLSYRFIEHCLHKDPRAIPPEDNSTAVLLAENCVTSTIENVWLEASTGNGQAIKEVRRDEVRFDDDFVDYNHIRVWVAGTSINAGAACRITPGPRKFNTIYEFLGFSHEEAAGFRRQHQTPAHRFRQRTDDSRRRDCGERGGVVVEVDAVEPGEAAIGRHPQMSGAALEHTGDLVVRQAVLHMPFAERIVGGRVGSARGQADKRKEPQQLRD